MPHPLLGFGLSRATVLSHHLTSNHYPPIDVRWIPICEKAIDIAVEAAYETGDGYDMDASVLQVEVGQGKTAGEVLDGLHLWDFVTAGIAVSLGFADYEGGYEPKMGE